jgi:catechol 2,3-dioxygenase-like lactoylglutathione lyase family enzyme
MTLTGFGNLAVKVADLDAALDFYAKAGARLGERGPWHGGERADLFLGPVQVTLFTRAIYEDAVELEDECFLHVAVFTDDLDAAMAGRDAVWGPADVEGNFGRRRIAFVDAPGGFRLEFMQQLDDRVVPSPTSSAAHGAREADAGTDAGGGKGSDQQ